MKYFNLSAAGKGRVDTIVELTDKTQEQAIVDVLEKELKALKDENGKGTQPK